MISLYLQCYPPHSKLRRELHSVADEPPRIQQQPMKQVCDRFLRNFAAVWCMSSTHWQWDILREHLGFWKRKVAKGNILRVQRVLPATNSRVEIAWGTITLSCWKIQLRLVIFQNCFCSFVKIHCRVLAHHLIGGAWTMISQYFYQA